MLGLLNTVLSRGGSLLTYVKDGLVMANRFLTPPKLTFPVDASAEFNGTSDYIDIGEKHIANDLGITNAFTMGAWIYLENDTDYKNILSMWDNTGNRIFWWGIDSSEAFHYNISLSGGDHATNTYPMTPNEWHYVNFRYDGSSLSLWHNGSSIFGYGATGNVDSRDSAILTESLLIGAQDDGAAAFMKGNLANVAIWNRALSSDEINSVMWKTYEQVSTTEKSGLQAWYKLSADEVLSGDSTATLTTYANANGLTFEAPACVQTALNGLPDITDARLYSANYDIRVSADGGNVESLSCVETELNAIL
jgi:hypothetical protein